MTEVVVAGRREHFHAQSFGTRSGSVITYRSRVRVIIQQLAVASTDDLCTGTDLARNDTILNSFLSAVLQTEAHDVVCESHAMRSRIGESMGGPDLDI